MSGKRRFEEQLAALEQLRRQPAPSAIKSLRKALADRSNYLVAKAADLARELRLAELIPDMVTAFDRFFTDPVKTDPQCWAKNALSRALAELEVDDAAIFLRGMRHIQLEGVWGGHTDTATTLRSTCAQALVSCRSLAENVLLNFLVDLFADKEQPVRVAAARAIDQVGSISAALLLRLRAVVGADEPEVLGACYSGILRIEGTAAIPWLDRFLASADDAAAEAALAIAADRSPQAFEVLREHFRNEHNPGFRGILLSAIALTRQPAGFEFLLELIRAESGDAEAAMEAILQALPPPEISAQLDSAISSKPRLARALAANRTSSA